MTKFKLFILLLLIVALMGCGTKMAMDKRREVYYQKVYPATLTDAFMFKTSISGGSMFPHGDDPLMRAFGCTVVPLCFVVDIPVSITTDTIFLPYDLYRNTTDIKPVVVAVRQNKLDEVKTLIKNGADPNDKYDFTTPLIEATRRGDMAMIMLLVDNGADVDVPGNQQYTPLMFASKFDVAQYLVSKGADVNAKNRDRYTVLMLHLFLDTDVVEKEKIMSLLIMNGADVNAVCNPFHFSTGDTILDIALRNKCPTQLIELLRNNGAKTAKELQGEQN